MDSKQLNRANEISKEIRELELFIDSAKNVWKGKILRYDHKYVFKSESYGAYPAATFDMNTEIKNKVLAVLEQHLEELKEELKTL